MEVGVLHCVESPREGRWGLCTRGGGGGGCALCRKSQGGEVEVAVVHRVESPREGRWRWRLCTM